MKSRSDNPTECSKFISRTFAPGKGRRFPSSVVIAYRPLAGAAGKSENHLWSGWNDCARRRIASMMRGQLMSQSDHRALNQIVTDRSSYEDHGYIVRKVL
jgi:hypothetical protein